MHHPTTAETCLQKCKTTMDTDQVMHHAFLRRFESEELSIHQLRRFGMQWYLAAKKHKEAFPAIVLNTPDDEIRFELIEILREEYGNGDRNKIHAKLLRRFLVATGLADEQIENAVALPATKVFGDEVLRIWRDGEPVYAFGLHFALEYIASALHTHLANGLEKYSWLTDDTREYFSYHRVAEQQHADYSELGVLRYAQDDANHARLERGVETALRLMSGLWEEFQIYVFESEPAHR